MRSKKVLIQGILIKLISVTILLLLGASTLEAKNANQSYKQYYDSITYAQYINQDWEGVIETGTEALNLWIDFYYLRMRIGIAAYNLEYYLMASENFTAALKFEPESHLAEEYLYYSYIFSGKQHQANWLWPELSIETRNKINDKPKIISKIFAGGGVVSSNNFSKNDTWFIDNGDTLPGSSLLTGNKTDIYAGLVINLSHDLSLTSGFNKLKVQKRVDYQYQESPATLDSIVNYSWGYQNYYSEKEKNYRVSFPDEIDQSELYLDLRYQYNRIMSFSIISNIVFISTGFQLPDTTVVTQHLIESKAYEENPVYVDYEYDNISFGKIDSSFVNYLAGINVEADFGRVVTNAFINWSDFNLGKQFNINLGALYYINRKGNFYGGSEINFFHEKNDYIGTENRFIFTQKLGGNIFNRFWSEGYITFGNLRNSSAEKGYIIYNQVDNTQTNAGITLSYYLFDNLSVNLFYKYIVYEGLFIDSSDDENIEYYNYQSQNIFGGIVWTF